MSENMHDTTPNTGMVCCMGKNFNIKEKRGTLDESKNSRNWKFWKLLSAS